MAIEPEAAREPGARELLVGGAHLLKAEHIGSGGREPREAPAPFGRKLFAPTPALVPLMSLFQRRMLFVVVGSLLGVSGAYGLDRVVPTSPYVRGLEVAGQGVPAPENVTAWLDARVTSTRCPASIGLSPYTFDRITRAPCASNLLPASAPSSAAPSIRPSIDALMINEPSGSATTA